MEGEEEAEHRERFQQLRIMGEEEILEEELAAEIAVHKMAQLPRYMVVVVVVVAEEMM